MGIVERDGEEKEEARPQEERLRDLARWIQAQRWNTPGTDKTWVFESEEGFRKLRDAFKRTSSE